MESASGGGVSRRTFLDWMLLLAAVPWLGSVLYPVFRYLTPLPEEGPGGPVRLGADDLAAIEKNRFAIVRIGAARVIVLRDPDDELRALNARCTHEGCTVAYAPEQALITCACHNGVFDIQGRVISGPPPKPLATYAAHEDADGEIVVSLEHV